jgi:hypothetical protein
VTYPDGEVCILASCTGQIPVCDCHYFCL